MSKAVKQMQMDALKQTFGSVRDLVVLSISGLNCQADNHLRHALRKRSVRLMLVKNSLVRRVMNELDVRIEEDSAYWKGNTVFAWGGSSIADLSRALDEELKNPKTQAQYKDKVQIKGAVADGQLVTFEQALKMPTRLEAIGRVIALALAPASRLVSQITAPGRSWPARSRP